MQLTTERLILRPWAETDAEDLYRYAKDDRVGPIAGWPPHSSVDNSAEIIRTVFSAPETYAVCLKEDNRAIGSIGLMIGARSDKEIPDTEGEIGYWIGVPFWGKGLIPEAARELIRHGFEDLELDKIWCGWFDGNEKSKRVQEKCGFVWHHTRKDVFCELMSDIRTEQITCLTRGDWLSQFKALYMQRLKPKDEEEELLSVLIDHLNATFVTEWVDADKVVKAVEDKICEDEDFRAKARSNSMSDLRAIFGDVVMKALAAILSDSQDMYEKFNEKPDEYMCIMNDDLLPIVYRRCNADEA